MCASKLMTFFYAFLQFIVLMYCVSPNERASFGRIMQQNESLFLSGMNRELYSVNPPQWDDDIRSMLAQTIGKPIPVNNMKRPNDDDSATSSTEIENCSFQQQSKKMKFNED